MGREFQCGDITHFVRTCKSLRHIHRLSRPGSMNEFVPIESSEVKCRHCSHTPRLISSH